MVVQNMLRLYVGNQVCSEKIISNSGCSRSEQIPLTDQKPEIIPPISELLSKTSNIPHTEACFQIYFFSINLKDCVQPV